MARGNSLLEGAYRGMVGQNIQGKCSDCGQWYWEKALDSNGRFIPTGVNAYGKKTYLNKGVHQCPGPNYMGSAGQKVDKLHQRTNEAINYVEDRAQSNHNNLAFLTGDMSILKEDMQIVRQLLEAVLQKLGIYEGADTILKRREQQQQQQQQADQTSGGPPPKRPDLNQLPTVDVNEQDYVDESEVMEEISNTDDTTHSDDTTSINFVNAPEVEQ